MVSFLEKFVGDAGRARAPSILLHFAFSFRKGALTYIVRARVDRSEHRKCRRPSRLHDVSRRSASTFRLILRVALSASHRLEPGITIQHAGPREFPKPYNLNG